MKPCLGQRRSVRRGLALAPLVLALLGSGDVAASEASVRIRAAYEAVTQAMRDGEYAKVARASYPRLVELAGGQEEMVAAIVQGVEQMREQGHEYLDTEIRTVSEPVKVGEELHAVISSRLRLKVPGGTLHQDTFVVAISANGGFSWTFVDGAGFTPEIRAMLFPTWDSTLELPEPGSPRILPDP